jgi:hypothetical protein
MAVEGRLELPAPPERVLAELADEAFLRAYADALGTPVEELAVTRLDGQVRTTLELRAPTEGIPDALARFVGTAVSVVDSRTWSRSGAGYRAELDVRASVFGRTAVVRGSRELDPSPTGAVLRTTAEASVDAPFVGRQAEAAVRELVEVVLRREAALLRERLRAD